jgi:deazaflavin-dependent oxidoreductase (nitroreductase family)
MANFFEKSFIGMHVNLYRWTGGRFMGKIRGTPILLLTTIGRKTGQARTTPLGYFTEGGDYIIVASNRGRPARPAWYLNLSQTPQVTIQVGSETINATAATVGDEDRAALWRKIAAESPAYAPYAQAERAIPLVRLHPTR